MKEDILEMHAIVQGRVQGVSFRATTLEFAKTLQINGTVRNLPNGTVEIFAQGTRVQLDKLIEMIVGDQAPGQVEHIDKSLSKPIHKFSNFSIIR